MTAELPPWSAFRAALAEAGFRPTRTRGQNFLVDTNMARAIAADAGVGEDDFVLEIGPGCGMLSVQLAALGVRLLAVEIEPRLARVAERFLADAPRAAVLVVDVLQGKHRLAPEVLARLPRDEPWHVVANLPYAIVGPLLMVLSRLPHPPVSMTLLVQRELALRAAAPPGASERGALSAKLQALYDVRVGRAVGRQLFRPRPRVESAVLELRRRPRPPGGPPGVPLEHLDALIDGLFAQRRKAVGGLLRRLLALAPDPARRLFEEAGVDPSRRASELAPEALEALAAHPAWAAAVAGGGPGRQAHERPPRRPDGG